MFVAHMIHTTGRKTTVLFTGAILFALLGLFVPQTWAVGPAAKPDGEKLYKAYCAHCHEGQVTRAPHRKILAKLPASLVLHSLQVGKMRMQGWVRTHAERRAMSEWITGKEIIEKDDTVAGFCADAPGSFSLVADAPKWSGWGVDNFNSRFQSTEHAGITADQVPQLKERWVFGLPMDFRVSQPTVAGGRVFIGAMNGRLYSINAKTGCLHWSIKTTGGIRSTPVVDTWPGSDSPTAVVYTSDTEANVYALDAQTGKQIWKVKVDDHPLATITGTPKTHDNRLYVSTTALEELAGGEPTYECCTFRGKVMALDRFNGKEIWRSYMIPDEPKPTRKNNIGTQLWGPSGASVWSSPTLDPEKNRLYVTTGDNYSGPASLTSDAMVGLELSTGKIVWTKQFTPNDAWNVACEQEEDTNCPEARGPDLDFASSSILRILPNGKRVLLAGQKSGVLHAVDPDKGEVLWQQRVGKGGLIGGIQWGSAADAKQIYVALSDIGVTTVADGDKGFETVLNNTDGGGMFAFDIESGKRNWHVPPPGCGDRTQCSPAQSAAVSAIPGAVFSGSVDGHLRAYTTDTGQVVWDYNAVQEYESMNGVVTRGGSFDGPGPTIVDGMLYVHSGYGFGGGTGGNALIAFSVDGK